MSKNPFAPLESTPAPSSSSPFHGRWAIWLVTCVLIGWGLLSLGMFAYQIQCRDPAQSLSGELYRDTPGAWMSLGGHLLRGSSCVWLSICAVRYLRALRNLAITGNDDYGELFAATQRGWNALGSCVFLILCFVAIGMADLEWSLSQSPRFARKEPPKFRPGKSVDSILIEFREADVEPREGLVKGAMTVIEPVEKVVYLGREIIVDNQDIVRAKAVVDENGEPALNLELSDVGAEKMKLATTRLIDRHLAIMIDGKVEQIPIVRSPISRSLWISGPELTASRIHRIVESINGNTSE